MFNNFFNLQVKTVTRAAGLLGISILISRLLGLFRDRLLAGRFGAGIELDIYFAAFRIPDFIYGALLAGGLAVVFLPIFSEYFKRNVQEAWYLTNAILNYLLIFLILVCLILIIFTPLLVRFIVPGFAGEEKILVVFLTRIMFLSPIFFGISSIFSGISLYFRKFFALALAPILYNLGIISGILFLVPVFENRILGVALGVILGAFLHFLILLFSARLSGFSWRKNFDFQHYGVKKSFQLMIPRVFSATANHLNLIVITAIASTLAVGSIAIFNFSYNLQGFAIGLVGISFAQAIFPVLSQDWIDGQKEKFLENFSLVFRQILFLIIPLSFLIFLLRAQIVRIILGTGQFGWQETRLTAASLGIFCLVIFASALIPLILKVFFSFQDTKTPALIGIASVGLSVSLAFLFTFLLKFPNIFQEFLVNFLKLQRLENIAVIGLVLALALSGLFHFFLLLIFLYKKIGDFRLREIWQSLKKIIIASIFLAIFTYLTRYLAAGFVDMKTFWGVFTQATLAGFVGIFIYILFARLLKSPELKTFKISIFR